MGLFVALKEIAGESSLEYIISEYPGIIVLSFISISILTSISVDMGVWEEF